MHIAEKYEHISYVLTKDQYSVVVEVEPLSLLSATIHVLTQASTKVTKNKSFLLVNTAEETLAYENVHQVAQQLCLYQWKTGNSWWLFKYFRGPQVMPRGSNGYAMKFAFRIGANI